MPDWILDSWLWLVPIIVFLGLWHIFRGRSPDCYIPKPLMHEEEIEIYNWLVRALPEFHIHPQVAMAAIVDVDAKDNETKRTMRNRIAQKYIDFVVARKDDHQVVGVVEYDGRYHNAEADQRRDARLLEAGYAVVRIAARPKPTYAEVARVVTDLRKIEPALTTMRRAA